MLIFLLLLALIACLVCFVYVLSLRKVVPTNEVHVVQRAKETASYGKEASDAKGNTYYKIPTWVPKYGIAVSVLPALIIDISIADYAAYDKFKVPFSVDIKAFFRISDFNLAASRVYSIDELKKQLESIVQGAVRSILAKDDLESIMSERTKYGVQFTDSVTPQLKEWGVTAVKNIELMDIRDGEDSKVIYNIMQKKSSTIEREMRVEIAKNAQLANEAELEAKQEIELKEQDVEQSVGLRKARVSQEVGIADEKQKQEVQVQAKITAEREMEVKLVKDVQAAEIEKKAALVRAEQDRAVIEVQAKASITKTEADKQVAILNAEADKSKLELSAAANKTQIELKADADLKAATNQAKGIKARGESEADARERMEKAQIAGQVELFDKVNKDAGYQEFLVKQRQVEAMEKIGVEQAKNLSNAEIKIFANADGVSDGVTQASKVLSPKTGLDAASMLEAFASTPLGKEVANKLLKGNKSEDV